MLRSSFHRVIFSSVSLQEKMLGHLCWKRKLTQGLDISSCFAMAALYIEKVETNYMYNLNTESTDINDW